MDHKSFFVQESLVGFLHFLFLVDCADKAA